jgi:hypothetical protein
LALAVLIIALSEGLLDANAHQHSAGIHPKIKLGATASP